MLRCCFNRYVAVFGGVPFATALLHCDPLVLLMLVFLFGCLCCEKSAGSGWGHRCEATPPLACGLGSP